MEMERLRREAGRTTCRTNDWPAFEGSAMLRTNFLIFLGLAAIVWIYLFITLAVRDVPQRRVNIKAVELSLAIDKLQIQVRDEQEEVQKLRNAIQRLNIGRTSQKIHTFSSEGVHRQWKEPMAVLVFTCNRPTAAANLIEKYRPSKDLFPIIISQDCDNVAVQRAVAKFRDQVHYIKHKSAQQEGVTVPSVHSRYMTYYYIARHYKLALEYVFDVLRYNTAILLEDDLDVSADFFEYFSATRYLLEIDPKLWCVSAWNDNGKNGSIDFSANSLLYRTDFFSGLGWMMTRYSVCSTTCHATLFKKLWKEFGPKWPAGFWDDWMREPDIRNDRQCIRPEISRTKMTPSGKEGASSNRKYKKDFFRRVYEDSPLVSIEAALKFSMQKENSGHSIRVEYTGNTDFIKKADKLHVMHDFKAGVPRTAYQGIVSCFFNGVRIFLVPNRNYVKEYDKHWEVPANYDM
ncbi:hypothetical protein KIN20_028238 [Parelaphostrongylus tenuis]|uniref:Alpha-1,3-mannosyl-glycoprotein 2-beta-N-acetylglucosaminyltransferase n=1 Tax=Parelaphostrongylus tenuis TaxID=148309 RepID=A0AAD5WEM6_PARTN|nr:hypothetical protein KIN20_028238 [Parelaphostrongylus tenuis]